MRQYALLLLASLLCSPCFAQGDTIASPQKVVKGYFSAKKDHRAGDLISRDDFGKVLQALKQTGESADRFAPLRERIPGPGSYLQSLNSGKKGKAFLRKLAKTPGGYASIEELAKRPGGKRTLREITSAKDGQKLIKYMATTRGGKQLMRMTPGGKKPKKPIAPRIYTAEDLLKAIPASTSR